MAKQQFRQILVHIEKIPYMAELNKDDKKNILTNVIRQYRVENKQVHNLPEYVISSVRSHYRKYINQKVDMLDTETIDQVKRFSEDVLLKQGYLPETVTVAVQEVFIYIKTKYTQLELTRQNEETKQELLSEYIIELVRCGTSKRVSLRYTREALSNLLFRRFTRNQSLIRFNFEQFTPYVNYVPSYELTAFQKEDIVKQYINSYVTLHYQEYVDSTKDTLGKFSESFDRYVITEMETSTRTIIEQIGVLLQELTTYKLVNYANQSDTRYKGTLNSKDYYFNKRVSERFRYMFLDKINTMKPTANQINELGKKAIEECQQYFVEKDLIQYSNNLVYIRGNSYEYRTLLEQIRNVPQNEQIYIKAGILYKDVDGLVMLVEGRQFYLTPIGLYELTLEDWNIKQCIAEYNQNRFDTTYYIQKVRENVKEQAVADTLINWLRFIFVEVKKGELN